MSAHERQQQQKTQGIEPIRRPTIVSRCIMRCVHWAEKLNIRFAPLGSPPVYDNAVFPWAREIEEAYPAIRSELHRILERQNDLPAFQDISPDVRTITTDSKWRTFFLLGYGLKSGEGVKACPQTWSAVQKIPGLMTAMFSIFEPGKHLPPHRGPYNGVLRLHLGLIVPAAGNDLGIRVNDQLCHWQEGKVLIFDDAYEHEAWNHTESTRVVLFVDFVKPLRFPARIVNKVVLKLALFAPFIKEGERNHRKWAKRFYGQVDKS